MAAHRWLGYSNWFEKLVDLNKNLLLNNFSNFNDQLTDTSDKLLTTNLQDNRYFQFKQTIDQSD